MTDASELAFEFVKTRNRKLLSIDKILRKL